MNTTGRWCFKRTVSQAHGRSSSFSPGFGCTIADAVIASSAAYPIFSRKRIDTKNGGIWTVVDGGYCANNPALFALTDALGPLGFSPGDVRLLSIGTGQFPERFRLLNRALSLFAPTITMLLKTSSNTVEVLENLLFKDVLTLRINDGNTGSRYKTDFIESDVELLKQIFDLGRESFAARESDLRQFFGVPSRA